MSSTQSDEQCGSSLWSEVPSLCGKLKSICVRRGGHVRIRQRVPASTRRVARAAGGRGARASSSAS